MDCPDCKTKITSSYLMVNSLSCPSCNISLLKLAKHIHNQYSWICYIIKHDNIVKYVGYTTELLTRIKAHIYDGVISRITENKATCSSLSLATNNIKICVSLQFSERDLIKIFKPKYNSRENNSYTHMRLMKHGSYIEYESITPSLYNITSTLINMPINKPQIDINHIDNAGIIFGRASLKNSILYRTRSYCFRWIGPCRCAVPCKQHIATMMLRSSIDKSYDIKHHLDIFKQDKIKERFTILKEMSSMLDDMLSSNINSTILMKQYMSKYNSITENNKISIAISKIADVETIKANSMSAEDPLLTNAKETHIHNERTVTLLTEVSAITITNYNNCIQQIKKAYNLLYGNDDPYSGISTLITKPSKVMTALNARYKTTTIGTILSAIIWSLRTAYINKSDNVTPLEIHMYMLIQRQIVEVRNAKQEELDGKLTEKEEKNFIPWETVLKARAAMEAKLDTTSFRDMADFVIVALYTYNPPIRADYANMRVFVFDDDVPIDYKDNYCVIDSPKPRFVFWKFKTATGTEAVVNPIHPTLHTILLNWLDINTSKYLLASTTVNGFIPMTENALSQRVRMIFNRWAGRTASINTLRHSFISYNSRDDQHVRQKETNAKMMMHSTAMADNYRRYVYSKK